MASDSLDSFLTTFSGHIQHLSNLQDTDKNLSENLKSSIKELYDFIKEQELSKSSPVLSKQTLKNLIVKGFDLEQIWQQVDLQNEATIDGVVQDLSGLMVAKNQLIFSFLIDGAKENHSDKNVNNSKIDLSESSECDSDLEEFGRKPKLKNAEQPPFEDFEEGNPNSLEDGSDEYETVKMNKKEVKIDAKKTYKTSIVDDQFFKLSEMEAFLEKEEDHKVKNDESGSESENESVDFFEKESDEEGEEDEAKTARFKDYFVEKEDRAGPKLKRNRLMEELEMDSEESEPEDEEELEKQLKSSLELRQERLKRKIEYLEEQAISEKPWQLKGEITAENRPQNSLLEEVVEFDLTSRPAPVITTETSLQLEDVIKQRIKDKAFDSVERKIRPVDTPLEYKKKLVLDQEKSKESLAKIYEKEFLDQQAELEKDKMDVKEAESETHKEVRKLMRGLFTKLDALSNFHFTTTPAVPELKIVSNISSINMEEVAPVSHSDAAMLAPEEIKTKPKGDIIGKGERSSTDKKRQRRKKKLKQKIHSKRKAKIEERKRANKKNRIKA
ncbi:U3 small nucleolar ribonucleoprotein protein MPP10-like isoform X1 [Euwallacea similis]|uniref:U3 small nucleolar ribonucleoprotein protein MPP10-like isoform X1 n=1 Tax=Euwallacea similis TaxID=1736056 RepID=UPI00344C4940